MMVASCLCESDEITKVKVLALTVDPRDIYYISWIIDGCEGIGFLQTDDPKSGKVSIFTSLSLLQDIKSLIEGLIAEGLKITIDSEYDYRRKDDEQ